MNVVATAPGKLILAGEYAVLYGAPAFVMAVDRRASVRVEPTTTDESRIRAPGFSDETGFVSNRGGPVWRSGEKPFGLVHALLAAAGEWPTANYVIDTRAFHDAASHTKLGLGSSAAVATATSVALGEYTSSLIPAALAATAHQRFQDGLGSGADIAASLAGGFIEYRMDEGGWIALDWPSDLVPRVFYSGRAQATTEQIRRAGGALESDKARLCDAAESLVPALRSGDSAATLVAIRMWTAALREFDGALQLGIFGGGHDVLSDLAEELGIVYKPCGAGGGDIGIALSTSEQMLEAFTATATLNGALPLNCKLDPKGAQVAERTA